MSVSRLEHITEIGVEQMGDLADSLADTRVAATLMINWGGAHCANYVRVVFSNESINRLRGIGDRFHRAPG